MIGRISLVSGLIILLYWGVIRETLALGTDTSGSMRKKTLYRNSVNEVSVPPLATW
jgi:hypothetical protein